MDLTCIATLNNLCQQYNAYKAAQSNCIATTCDTYTIQSYQRQMDALLKQIDAQMKYCVDQINLGCSSLPNAQFYVVQYPLIYNPGRNFNNPSGFTVTNPHSSAGNSMRGYNPATHL